MSRPPAAAPADDKHPLGMDLPRRVKTLVLAGLWIRELPLRTGEEDCLPPLLDPRPADPLIQPDPRRPSRGPVCGHRPASDAMAAVAL